MERNKPQINHASSADSLSPAKDPEASVSRAERRRSGRSVARWEFGRGAPRLVVKRTPVRW